jgi:hypothetical protein
MRVTALDGCGRVKLGACSAVVSDGFVSVALTASIQAGTDISVVNAAGKVCVQDKGKPSFQGYTMVITFCQVNPDLIALLTNQARVFDPVSSEAVGFRVNEDASQDYGFALELWSNVPGVACDPANPNAAGSYGYVLFPFVEGGTFGDFTIDNNAVSFVVSGASTKAGSAWGKGPYNVVTQTGGTAGPLTDDILSGDHLHIQYTDVAPPDPACTCIANGVPATGATMGAPATLTPTNSYPPDDLTDAATGFTASPATAWTSGSYVVLGDGSQAYWSGTAWTAGMAP